MPEQRFIQRQPIFPLEQLLYTWEDYWFLMALNARMLAANQQPLPCRPERAFVHHGQLRNFLLSLHGSALSSITSEAVGNFLPPPDFPPDLSESRWEAFQFPANIAAWTLHSRRAYRLNADMQGILRATSLHDVRWQDVEWPFPSFAIMLEQPLVGPDGEGQDCSYDFLLVTSSNINGRPVRTLTAFASSRSQHQPLGELKKRQLQVYAQHRQWQKLGRQLNEFLASQLKTFFKAFSGFSMELTDSDESVLVTDTAARQSEEKLVAAGLSATAGHDLCDQMARMVVGFALYLRSLPNNSPHISRPQRLPFRGGAPDRKSITRDWEVCSVTSVIELTHEERVMLGVVEGEEGERASYELSCHFREGHWRRPPGHGQIPDAPKTVHVRPCIVRRDRLSEGELPGGAIKEL